MATNNTTIAGRVYLSGTNDFQQRVPNPTISGIDATSKFLFDPMNRRYLNEFVDAYVNRIGTQIVHNNQWENPLTVFKGPNQRYGASIQESAVKWLRAHTYDVDDATLLKVERPEAAVWYHTVNRKDRYDITVELPDLQQAFADEMGLNRLIDAIMTVPRNSDNYDEYLCMLNQIAYYEQNWQFFKHKVTAAPTDEATGKEFLKAVRAYAKKLKFPSSLYSPVSAEYGIPTFAKPEELVLFITADAAASIDVDTLASVFQLDKAEAAYRTIEVPELPVPNAFALLTTDSFFVCNDYVYANESFYNPQTLSTNYYLHHWEVVSASPFVPAILFTTDSATTVSTLTQSVTGVNITAAKNSLKPGDTTQLTVSLTGTVTENDEGIEVAPDAVTWSVSGETAASEGEPLDLNGATRVDRLGVLHTQKTGLKKNNVLHVTGTTSYVNPSGKTTAYTKTVDITIA
jgi:hypothetical protein